MTKILVVGFGTVGQGFFELLHSKQDQLGLKETTVSEIVDKKFGYIRNPGQDVVDRVKSGGTFEMRNVLDTIRETDADVVCEFTWVNMKDGEPAFSFIKEALGRGKHVITTNKGPIALQYEKLNEVARESGAMLRFKGTVMAGTPSFNILKLLPGIGVHRIRGIFNGTTNFILTEMAKGMSFAEGLRLAQSKGYAEADPTMDVDGFDAALKAIIFSKVIGWSHHNLKDMEIKGIRDISISPGTTKTKLLVSVDRNAASVKPTEIPQDDVLSNINGVLNAVEITTDTLGKIMVVGPGAGRTETAQAVISDLMEVLKK